MCESDLAGISEKPEIFPAVPAAKITGWIARGRRKKKTPLVPPSPPSYIDVITLSRCVTSITSRVISISHRVQHRSTRRVDFSPEIIGGGGGGGVRVGERVGPNVDRCCATIAAYPCKMEIFLSREKRDSLRVTATRDRGLVKSRLAAIREEISRAAHAHRRNARRRITDKALWRVAIQPVREGQEALTLCR